MSDILAKVIRNGRIESIHRGHVAVVDAGGNLIAATGNPDLKTYIRSAAKPFQFMPVLEEKLDEAFNFTDKELAVMMASHNGEDFHINAVKSILKKIGLDATYLKCGYHPPFDKTNAEKIICENLERSPIYNNCSGKHAGMLSVAVKHDWSLNDYLNPKHPVQQFILNKVAQFSELPVDKISVGVDGCSAPVFYLPLRKMAYMYARLAKSKEPLAERIFQLMSQNAEMIAGTGRFDTQFMQLMNGRMISKVGAEGIRCVGVQKPRPLGIAIKVEDGNKRASHAVILETLAQLKLISEEEKVALKAFYKPRIKNHSGIETGFIKVQFKLKFFTSSLTFES